MRINDGFHGGRFPYSASTDHIDPISTTMMRVLKLWIQEKWTGQYPKIDDEMFRQHRILKISFARQWEMIFYQLSTWWSFIWRVDRTFECCCKYSLSARTLRRCVLHRRLHAKVSLFQDSLYIKTLAPAATTSSST